MFPSYERANCRLSKTCKRVAKYLAVFAKSSSRTRPSCSSRQSQDTRDRLELQGPGRPQLRQSRLQTLVRRARLGTLRNEKETAGAITGTRQHRPRPLALLAFSTD